MIYNCPHCQQKFDISESGRYCCSSCNQEFEVTIPKTPDLVKVLVPEPIEPEQQENVCPFCKLSIPAGARKCGHCGEWINGKPMNRSVYLALSFYLGHIGIAEFYSKNHKLGMAYGLIFVLICGYSIYEPAFVLGFLLLWVSQLIIACVTTNQ